MRDENKRKTMNILNTLTYTHTKSDDVLWYLLRMHCNKFTSRNFGMFVVDHNGSDGKAREKDCEKRQKNPQNGPLKKKK